MIKIEKLKEEKKKNKVTLLFKGIGETLANTIRRTIIEEVPTLAVEDLESKGKCAGAGCAQCELKMTLKVGKKGYVYAEDAESSDSGCTFVYPKMPITKLLAKQKVDLQMTAVLGKGKDHAKWIPGLAIFKPEPQIKIGNVKDAQGIANSCPQKIFNLKGDKITVNKDNLYDCHFCQKCVELDKNISFEETGN